MTTGPGTTCSVEEAHQAGLLEFLQLRPGGPHRRRDPRHVNPEVARPASLRAPGDGVVPASGVAVIEDCLVWPDRQVQLADGRFLATGDLDVSPGLPVVANPSPIAEVACAIHYTKFGVANYGHHLVEMLPRLLLNAEVLPASCPILGRAATRPWVEPMLTTAGIDPLRSLWLTARRPVRVDRLHWPTPVSRNWSYAAEIPPALRALVPEVSTDPRRKLFCGRSDARTRRLVDEDLLAGGLARLGFERVVPGRMSFPEQVRAFAATRTLVGVGGAALANMVFMPPGGRVMALLTDTMNVGFFAELADRSGHELTVVWGTPTGPTPGAAPREARDRRHHDFRVDHQLVVAEAAALVAT